MRLQFKVPGEPVGKGRPRFVRATGRTYTPEKTQEYEALVKELFVSKYPDHVPSTAFLTMKITAAFIVPASWSKKKRAQALAGKIRPTRIDWDNTGKIVSDALNKIAYVDDRQIYRAEVEKIYSEKHFVEVVLEYEED